MLLPASALTEHICSCVSTVVRLLSGSPVYSHHGTADMDRSTVSLCAVRTSSPSTTRQNHSGHASRTSSVRSPLLTRNSLPHESIAVVRQADSMVPMRCPDWVFITKAMCVRRCCVAAIRRGPLLQVCRRSTGRSAQACVGHRRAWHKRNSAWHGMILAHKSHSLPQALQVRSSLQLVLHMLPQPTAYQGKRAPYPQISPSCSFRDKECGPHPPTQIGDSGCTTLDAWQSGPAAATGAHAVPYTEKQGRPVAEDPDATPDALAGTPLPLDAVALMQ